ncbi:F0F1 ATP synthase subunit B [Clavibacter sp. VKM Ac-2873]|uniref:F0F1 ATP synthase subunit B n=1 Tax=Clavibacter sp. VKM Ac-2873 TaxID=2783813 RepID=UPI00188D8E17|nr:F0F1 ATP synthase subunit B [Clavibacter sp. VKM Ac-2873]MBF4617138.1 F0F1 ATP synthase subunit B [Clavibacter sp. VKM Ac-2873]
MLTPHNVMAAEGEKMPQILIPEIYDIVWSALVFVVLLVVVWKLVLPRVYTMLDARTEAIAGGIEKAERAQAEADAAKAELTAQLAEARVEAGRIREQARADATAIAAEIKEQATADAARITASAQQQIEAERQQAVVSLRSEVGSLAIDLASGVIGQSLTDDQRSTALVDRFLADLEASEASGRTGSAS